MNKPEENGTWKTTDQWAIQCKNMKTTEDGENYVARKTIYGR